MRKTAFFLAILALCSPTNAGTMLIEGLPERVNTWAGPVTLSFDIVSNGQLDNDSLFAWTYTPGMLDCSNAVNNIHPDDEPCWDGVWVDPWCWPWPCCIFPEPDPECSRATSPVWADIAIPKAVPRLIVGNIITDLALTIPQGFEGTLQVKVLSELSGQIQDVATIEVYTECIPNTAEYELQYVQWVVMGKPACWCNDYGAPHTQGNQCYGDAAGDTHSQGYIVYTQDLQRLVNSWKAKIRDPNLDPCADFDHRAHPTRGYRVYTGDLAILSANWKATELPGDCPKTDADIGL